MTDGSLRPCFPFRPFPPPSADPSPDASWPLRPSFYCPHPVVHRRPSDVSSPLLPPPPPPPALPPTQLSSVIQLAVGSSNQAALSASCQSAARLALNSQTLPCPPPLNPLLPCQSPVLRYFVNIYNSNIYNAFNKLGKATRDPTTPPAGPLPLPSFPYFEPIHQPHSPLCLSYNTHYSFLRTHIRTYAHTHRTPSSNSACLAASQWPRQRRSLAPSLPRCSSPSTSSNSPLHPPIPPSLTYSPSLSLSISTTTITFVQHPTLITSPPPPSSTSLLPHSRPLSSSSIVLGPPSIGLRLHSTPPSPSQNTPDFRLLYLTIFINTSTTTNTDHSPTTPTHHGRGLAPEADLGIPLEVSLGLPVPLPNTSTHLLPIGLQHTPSNSHSIKDALGLPLPRRPTTYPLSSRLRAHIVSSTRIWLGTLALVHTTEPSDANTCVATIHIRRPHTHLAAVVCVEHNSDRGHADTPRCARDSRIVGRGGGRARNRIEITVSGTAGARPTRRG